MNVRTTAANAFLVGVTLILNGCSSDSSAEQPSPTPSPPATSAAATGAPEPPPAVTATPTPTPSPSATEMSIEEAAQQYLEIVRPSNEFVRKNGENTIDTWQQNVALMAEYVGHLEAFGAGLEAAEWPDHIQPFVDDVVAQNSANMEYLRAIATAQSEEEHWAAMNEPDDRSNAASQALREQLGLGDVGDDE